MEPLIVFDIDGTLTDTKAADDACFVQTFQKEFNIQVQDIRWENYTYQTDSGLAEQILTDHYKRTPTPDELARLHHHFMLLIENESLEQPEKFREIPGASALLAQIADERKWLVAIATGSWRASGELKLARAGLDIRGIPLASGDDHVARENIITTAIARAGSRYNQTEFSRIVYVGDGVWDVRAARQLRLPFIGIGSGEQEEALRAEGAHYVVANYMESAVFLQLLERAVVPQSS